MVKAPMSDPSGYSVSLTLTGAGSGSARSPLPKSTVVYLPAGSDGGPSGLHFGSGLTEVPPGGRHSKYVVVTDIVMPRMGGPELAKKLCHKREGVAVIFMSGYTEAAAIENAEIGMDAILLNKPFATEALARKINEVQQRAAAQKSAGAAAGSSV